MKRNIIKIDEEKCTGCGQCVPACPEGAIQMIDGKARLVSDLHCDGLGACIGDCPFGAISTEFREAEAYDEVKVLQNIIPKGINTLKAHLKHLWSHGEVKLYNQAFTYLQENQIPIPEGFTIDGEIPDHLRIKPGELKIGGCVEGEECASIQASVGDIESKENHKEFEPQTYNIKKGHDQGPYLSNWPIKLKLTQVKSSTYDNAHLLIAADCVSGSIPNFQQNYLPSKKLLMGCPKFDDPGHYIEKLAKIFQLNTILSVQVLRMEVPCCSGLIRIVEEALRLSGKQDQIPFTKEIIRIDLKK